MESQLDQRFLLDIPTIDKQHQKFYDMFHKITLQDASKDKEALDLLISELENYTVTHFRYEEALMKNAGYTELDDHIKEHRYFEQTIQQMRIEQGYSNPVLFEKTILFIKKWFLDHILNTDKKYLESVDSYLKTRKVE